MTLSAPFTLINHFWIELRMMTWHSKLLSKTSFEALNVKKNNFHIAPSHISQCLSGLYICTGCDILWSSIRVRKNYPKWTPLTGKTMEEASGRTTMEGSNSREGQTWNRCRVYRTNYYDTISSTCIWCNKCAKRGFRAAWRVSEWHLHHATSPLTIRAYKTGRKILTLVCFADI